LLLPKVIIAIVIFGIGWVLASWVEGSVLKSLHREEIPRASLIAKFVKSILLIFFSAISLVELDVAREIVIIGFATIFHHSWNSYHCDCRYWRERVSSEN